MVDTEQLITVRRRWSANETARVRVQVLWDFHLRNDAGGVCGAFPRAFLCAHAWCDQFDSAALGHACRESAPPPHDLVVYILPADNSAELFEGLRERAGR